MRGIFRFFALSVIAAALMPPALAQTNLPQAGTTSQPAQSEEEIKYALYQKFVDAHQDDQPTAYQIAQEYLRKYPQDTEYTRYLKRWVDAYAAREKMRRKWQVGQLIEQRRFDEAFALGNELLTQEPEDVDTLYTLAVGGLFALTCGNKSFVAEANNDARHALELIEPTQAADKEKILGRLNLVLGIFSLESSPAESATYFYKAMRLEAFKRDVETYAFLADAILGAEYMPIQKDYQSHFDTPEKKASPQGRAVRAKLNRAADRVIDALARAVALAGSDPKFAQAKAAWMNILTELYKFRNSGYETGLPEYIEEILAKPMPQQQQSPQ